MVDYYFLQANPEIAEMMKSDLSLGRICYYQDMQRITNQSIPTLYNREDINYNLYSFDISNLMKILLCMIINRQLNYTMYFKNLSCSENEVKRMMSDFTTAFDIVHSKFIEYFSGIYSFQVSVRTKLFGRKVVECDVSITLQEKYYGALNDTFKFLGLCSVVKNELLRQGKIYRGMSQKDIARVLYNWVCLHINYDETFNDMSFTGYGSMINGVGVCQGITAMYNALCKLFGISIVGMSGIGKGKNSPKVEKHIWSYAILDGNYYYIDTTWRKPVFMQGEILRQHGVEPTCLCNFEYFCVPYNKFIQEHSWDRKIYG